MPQTIIVPHTDASSDVIARYKAAVARRDAAAKKNLRRYYSDPVAWVHDCIDWDDDEDTAPYQDEIMQMLVDEGRVAARGPRGLGKTTLEALVVLWFALTRDAAGVDWKVITTAGGYPQLKHFLWPEIHLWARKLNWARLGREPFTRNQLLLMELNLKYGSAFARSSDRAELTEGAHAESLLYVFDEAKAIQQAMWDSSEGAFANAGKNGTEAFALAASTPGEPVGRFYDICKRKPGLADQWAHRHVTIEEAIDAGLIQESWPKEMALVWGEAGALYHNHVLGEFYSGDEDSVIPLAWVERAMERWKMRQANEHGVPLGSMVDRVGVDVARSGNDKTVLALRTGNRIDELQEFFHIDTMQTAGHVKGLLDRFPGCVAAVDTDGLGAGVTDRLNEQDCLVQAFHAGSKTDKKDKSGYLGFVNVRSAAWWAMREALDPASGMDVELPPNDVLAGELVAPHWVVKSEGRIEVEKKDDVKKRLGRSTDHADAVMHSFWEERKKRRARMHYENALAAA